jgi:hypothetical protein
MTGGRGPSSALYPPLASVANRWNAALGGVSADLLYGFEQVKALGRFW